MLNACVDLLLCKVVWVRLKRLQLYSAGKGMAWPTWRLFRPRGTRYLFTKSLSASRVSGYVQWMFTAA